MSAPPVEPYGVGPVKDVARGIDSTWTLDVPRRVGCTCPRCTPDPIPLEGWTEGVTL
jgi:hypothetical protein